MQFTVLDLSFLFSEHFHDKFDCLCNICNLDGPLALPRRAPPNWQVNFDLLLERSDASPSLFLLVCLPWDVYFLQVDHRIVLLVSHPWTRQLCSQAWLACNTLKCSFNSIAHYILTNKTNSHQRTNMRLLSLKLFTDVIHPLWAWCSSLRYVKRLDEASQFVYLLRVLPATREASMPPSHHFLTLKALMIRPPKLNRIMHSTL